ncbi:AMP-binding protein [Sneathiella sp. P13V-1]|uniref:AMP-binding protein n=1 Tax=Sneathiella sp. P13V-1 TaxID=2697366 RepID=UPI00187B87DC|nr:AMP-binding protein [Sneathiella sp. P13V-1]MBE7637487.1 AMP-binding protein [Sneathiella sp. P13V-1]
MSQLDYFYPPKDIQENSNLCAFLKENGFESYEALNDFSIQDPDTFWDMILKWQGIVFEKPYTKIRDTSAGIEFIDWCVNGQMNLVSSCLDCYENTDKWEKPAIEAIDEAGNHRVWTYRDYYEQSCRVANTLAEQGIGKGDRVAIFMPMIPEMAAAFMAIARLGAVAIPLFSGFAAPAIALRLEDAEAKAVVTATSTVRAGRKVEMLPALLEAVETCPTVASVLCLKREGDDLPEKEGLSDWAVTTSSQSPTRKPVAVTYKDPLFVAFTSGTTGKPKGVVQGHLGIIGKTITDFFLCLDMKETDRHIWMTDMGWVMGPLTILSSSLAGATVILAEGAPTTKEDPFRLLRLVDELKISHLGIAPTVARQFMTLDQSKLAGLSLSSLRIVASTGEAWTPDAWYWALENICKRRAVPVNMSGGTELVGAILTSTVLQPIPPCGFSTQNLGVGAKVMRADGTEADIGEVGELVMTEAPMGVTMGLWKDNDRYIRTYWSTFPGVWHHGDWAHRNEDGTWHIHGRSDDTINVAGKRVGPPEIEGALMENPIVADAAAISVPDDIKGVAVVCFCVLKEGAGISEDLVVSLRSLVAEKVGKPFAPREILFAPELPKTRSMKTMRRVIRATYLDENPGDLSSLSNPDSIEKLKLKQ